MFCYIYNVFLIFLIDFFLLNPTSASLKSLDISTNSRSKFNFKVKYDFSTNEARNKCNTSILCDFDTHLLSIFEINLIIQGHLQGQKVNFKVK